jgi:hypothetical protein
MELPDRPAGNERIFDSSALAEAVHWDKEPYQQRPYHKRRETLVSLKS